MRLFRDCLTSLVCLTAITFAHHIVKDVPFCRSTNNSIDLEGECFDKNCAMYKNLVYIYSQIPDEFHHIFKSDGEKIIVYSNHGRAFYTDCTIINAFDVKENVTVCTLDTLVGFQYQYQQTEGYYTKNAIIREKNNYNKLITCSSSMINVGNLNSEFSIYKLDNHVTVARRNDSLTKLDFEHQAPIIEAYDRTFGNSNTFIIVQALIICFLCILRFLKCIYVTRSVLWDKLIMIFSKIYKKTSFKEKKIILPTTIDNRLLPAPSAPFHAPNPIQFNPPFAKASVPDQPFSIYDPNVYQSIYDPNGNYHQIPRSQSVTTMSDDLKGDQIRCPECGQVCKGQVGLAMHKSKSHKIYNLRK
jgi:hypothetical protein